MFKFSLIHQSFNNFTFEANIAFPFRLLLDDNLDLETENNTKKLQKPKANFKTNEKLPESARESESLELLYQYSVVFHGGVKHKHRTTITKKTLHFSMLYMCVCCLYKAHGLGLIENHNRTHTEKKNPPVLVL